MATVQEHGGIEQLTLSALRNVIGHNESLSSPYHRERVARLRTQTHGDWVRADMRVFRRRLRALGSCAS